jgi:hypothetical protein
MPAVHLPSVYLFCLRFLDVAPVFCPLRHYPLPPTYNSIKKFRNLKSSQAIDYLLTRQIFLRLRRVEVGDLLPMGIGMRAKNKSNSALPAFSHPSEV